MTFNPYNIASAASGYVGALVLTQRQDQMLPVAALLAGPLVIDAFYQTGKYFTRRARDKRMGRPSQQIYLPGIRSSHRSTAIESLEETILSTVLGASAGLITSFIVANPEDASKLFR